jgi:7-carboxy-7-deazaguanine synthase
MRLIEHYTSTQGEGPRVGTLTQFVRFAGCNLSCALWPCDSQFAIDPKLYREEQYPRAPWELAADIEKMQRETGASNVCFTGGEPFLQPHKELIQLLHAMYESHQVEWQTEAFTNGTFEVPVEVFLMGLQLVMDWKLPGSGEKVWLNERSRNLAEMSKYGGVVKFTVANELDFEFALDVWNALVQDSGVSVFVGPVWSDTWTASNVVDLIKKHKVPWRLNVQIHQYIYGHNVRGT